MDASGNIRINDNTDNGLFFLDNGDTLYINLIDDDTTTIPAGTIGAQGGLIVGGDTLQISAPLCPSVNTDNGQSQSFIWDKDSGTDGGQFRCVDGYEWRLAISANTNGNATGDTSVTDIDDNELIYLLSGAGLTVDRAGNNVTYSVSLGDGLTFNGNYVKILLNGPSLFVDASGLRTNLSTTTGMLNINNTTGAIDFNGCANYDGVLPQVMTYANNAWGCDGRFRIKAHVAGKISEGTKGTGWWCNALANGSFQQTAVWLDGPIGDIKTVWMNDSTSLGAGAAGPKYLYNIAWNAGSETAVITQTPISGKVNEIYDEEGNDIGDTYCDGNGNEAVKIYVAYHSD
jgi:hypothetical protein